MDTKTKTKTEAFSLTEEDRVYLLRVLEHDLDQLKLQDNTLLDEAIQMNEKLIRKFKRLTK